jgi:hypothetical protein
MDILALGALSLERDREQRMGRKDRDPRPPFLWRCTGRQISIDAQTLTPDAIRSSAAIRCSIGGWVS